MISMFPVVDANLFYAELSFILIVNFKNRNSSNAWKKYEVYILNIWLNITSYQAHPYYAWMYFTKDVA